jgi:hypothetical protein
MKIILWHLDSITGFAFLLACGERGIVYSNVIVVTGSSRVMSLIFNTGKKNFSAKSGKTKLGRRARHPENGCLGG